MRAKCLHTVTLARATMTMAMCNAGIRSWPRPSPRPSQGPAPAILSRIARARPGRHRVLGSPGAVGEGRAPVIEAADGSGPHRRASVCEQPPAAPDAPRTGCCSVRDMRRASSRPAASEHARDRQRTLVLTSFAAHPSAARRVVVQTPRAGASWRCKRASRARDLATSSRPLRCARVALRAPEITTVERWKAPPRSRRPHR
jgi:hypothetical protein